MRKREGRSPPHPAVQRPILCFIPSGGTCPREVGYANLGRVAKGNSHRPPVILNWLGGHSPPLPPGQRPNICRVCANTTPKIKKTRNAHHQRVRGAAGRTVPPELFTQNRKYSYKAQQRARAVPAGANLCASTTPIGGTLLLRRLSCGHIPIDIVYRKMRRLSRGNGRIFGAAGEGILLPSPPNYS